MDGFEKMKARVEQFAQNIMPYAPSPELAAEIGEKMKMCVDVLREQYDAYLNESDPVHKEFLHKAFQAKAEEFVEILRLMARQI
jgi:hypothetical protein